MRIFDMNCSCQGGNLDRFLQPHILLILDKGPMYGLEIINHISERNMFATAGPDPTGVYRYLKRMEEDGHLATEMKAPAPGERPRKFYSVTDKGRECLANWAVALGQYSVDIIGLVRDIEDAIEK